MPLPVPNTSWPPTDFRPVFDRFREHDAWYRGDIDTLQAIYATGAPSATHAHNGEARTGGIYGTVLNGISNLFWGKRVTPGTRRTALHVPLAADVATMKSDMLWAEPPEFTSATADPDGLPSRAEQIVQDRLDLIMNSDEARMMFAESGELTSALGGTYFSVAWNTATNDHVYPRAHDADTAIPEWSAGRLAAVTFWSSHADGEDFYRHFERHEPGRILHGLYKGTGDNVGFPVPADTLPELAWLVTADRGKEIDPETHTVTLYTGITRLTAAYEPNVKKDRDFRKLGTLAHLGRSDYAGVESELNAVDEAWSSYMRDLKIGRGRIFIPQNFLKTTGPGRGASWDEEQEVFAQIDSIKNVDDKAQITAQQFEIRTAAHEQMILSLSKIVLRNAGLGARDYEERAGNLTATGELMRDKREETTFDKQKRYATSALTYIASVALELDAIVFPGRGGIAGAQVAASWPQELQVDAEKESRIIAQLSAARAISTWTAVKRANPDWNDDLVKKEVDRINAEHQPLQLTDPSTFTGADDNEDQSDAENDAA
ncbi:phage portal protein [Gryllotalpicola koreensis]|uniref:Phage portal protein n=1 Tax=Gryllotalpicola koreensis TaxID=993086 RepID=A0ABP8A2X0_9MICO